MLLVFLQVSYLNFILSKFNLLGCTSVVKKFSNIAYVKQYMHDLVKTRFFLVTSVKN
jgi:hypothetical protein